LHCTSFRTRCTAITSAIGLNAISSNSQMYFRNVTIGLNSWFAYSSRSGTYLIIRISQHRDRETNSNWTDIERFCSLTFRFKSCSKREKILCSTYCWARYFVSLWSIFNYTVLTRSPRMEWVGGYLENRFWDRWASSVTRSTDLREKILITICNNNYSRAIQNPNPYGRHI
jgi:hypothetical protein